VRVMCMGVQFFILFVNLVCVFMHEVMCHVHASMVYCVCVLSGVLCAFTCVCVCVSVCVCVCVCVCACECAHVCVCVHVSASISSNSMQCNNDSVVTAV